MFTTHNTTREQGLVAAAAVERAMNRHVCCKSQFKFKCFSCGEMINRGDKITKCTTSKDDGMDLRFRGADSRNGLTMDETAFYMAQTGTRTWVHIGCIPCYWDSLPEDSNEYSPPALRSVWTDWGTKMADEFEEWRQRTNHYDMEEFCEKHGYPQEKWMKDRIERAVTRFQAIWRGYIYKKAYPIALRAARATEAINLNARATLSTQSKPPHNHYARIKANSERDDAEAEAMFYCHNKSRVGSNSTILFNRGEKTEAIYSCEIVTISGESNGVQVYVKFHYDQERRKYHWKRFKLLERECHSFMIERGMLLLEFEGKIPTNPHFWNGHN